MKLNLRHLLAGGAFCMMGASLHAVDQTARVSVFYTLPGDTDFSGVRDASLEGKGGAGLGIAYGFNFPLLRAEVEFLGADYDSDGIEGEELNDYDGDFNRYGLFGNAIFDLPGVPFIDPYLGAGVGVVRTSVDVTVREVETDGETTTITNEQSIDDAKMTPAVQLMAGFKAEIADRIYGTLGYRLLYADQSIQKSAIDVSPNELTHLFEVSLGYNF